VICGHVNLLPVACMIARRPILMVYGIEAWKESRVRWRRLLHRCGAIVSISEITRDRLCAWSQYHGKTYLLPNAIRAEDYGIRPRRPDLVARYGLGGKRVLLTVGRLESEERYKGFDEVLEVLPNLPGDIVYIRSQLLERAGKFLPELGGGTMTFFPVVATIQGDITGYIQTNLISITDGQLYLNTTLFQRGFKPAIDFGLSVSRIGNRAQCAAMKEVSGKLRLEYLQYQELLRMTTMKADLSGDAETRLRRGELITQLFTQKKGQPSSLAEQVVFLYAVKRGLLDQVPQLWQQFKREIFGWLQQHHPQVLRDIQERQTLMPKIKQDLDEAIDAFLHEAEPAA
jgi:hypothetical protein